MPGSNGLPNHQGFWLSRAILTLLVHVGDIVDDLIDYNPNSSYIGEYMKKFEVFSDFPHLFWNLGDLRIAVRDYRIHFREFQEQALWREVSG